MKFLKLVALIFAIGVFVSCGSSPQTSEPNKRFQPFPEEIKMLELTNAARAQSRTCGTEQFPAAPAVTWVETILDTAWFHSVAMSQADNENHVNPSTIERLQARGYEADAAGENRKKTALPANPDDAFNAWLNDAEACAKIMNASFTNLGVGLQRTSANAFWTMILASPKGSAPTPTPNPTLTMSPLTATVTVGDATAVTFSATLAGATDTITWALTGEGTLSATAGASTSYTAPATGDASTATLTATAGALTATATITINAATPTPLPSLTVTPETATVTVGDPTAVDFNAVLSNAADPIGWTLTGEGTLSTNTGPTTSYTPPATGDAGSATLTATAGALTASATITINAAAPTPTLSVSPTTATATVGNTATTTFTATLTNATDTVNWTLDGAGSLSDATGLTTNYTPPATGDAGTATVTATAGALTATATVTINAALPPPGSLIVEVKPLNKEVITQSGQAAPVAPLGSNPNGGGYILWTRKADEKAILTQIDASGNTVGADQDLGPGKAGAVSTDGTNIAFLIKTGDDQMAFRVQGKGETLVVDNRKPGVWVPTGETPKFGNEALFKPITYRRLSILPIAEKWFTSFDHWNDFGAGGEHTGMSMLLHDADGTNPVLAQAWGTSHSLDIVAHYDGEHIINIALGDAFPMDFNMHVFDKQGQTVLPGTGLFAKRANAENLVGRKHDLDFATNTCKTAEPIKNVYGVAADGRGSSSARLGALLPIGGGKFALTYRIKKESYTGLFPTLCFENNSSASTVSELGLIIFDKQGVISEKHALRTGDDVKYVKTAKYGSNLLVAWENTTGEFWAKVVTNQGTEVLADQKLAAGVMFTENDQFVTMNNGDVMWTASDSGNLKLFRLPAP